MQGAWTQIQRAACVNSVRLPMRVVPRNTKGLSFHYDNPSGEDEIASSVLNYDLSDLMMGMIVMTSVSLLV
jgi:hypothetical protein